MSPSITKFTERTQDVYLPFADDLLLPIDVVTRRLAWLGIPGSGKTYAAMKLAELMLEQNAQIIVFDPVYASGGPRRCNRRSQAVASAP
jgi:hypothetical protein